MKAFVMTDKIAKKFFTRCLEREAITEAERIKIMHELIHEENIKVLKEEQLHSLLEGKKVLVVESKKRVK